MKMLAVIYKILVLLRIINHNHNTNTSCRSYKKHLCLLMGIGICTHLSPPYFTEKAPVSRSCKTKKPALILYGFSPCGRTKSKPSQAGSIWKGGAAA